MQIKIKRFDKSLPLPEYKTKSAAAFDLYSRLNITISPNKVILIPLNIAVQLPKGYHSILLARSSMHKLGIIPANGIGLIDQDYCGDDDELCFPVINFTNQEIKIEKGTRLAQLLIEKTEVIELLEVDHLNNLNRGGFGTTGVK